MLYVHGGLHIVRRHKKLVINRKLELLNPFSMRLSKRQKHFSGGALWKKRPPEIPQNSQEKHPHQSLSFNKAAGLKLATLLKKRPRHRRPPANPAKPPRAFLCSTPPVAASEKMLGRRHMIPSQ